MTDTTARQVIPVKGSEMMVPVCPACRMRSAMKWWLATILTSVVIYVVAAVCMLWIHIHAIPVSLSGLIAGVVIPGFVIAGLIDWFIDPHLKPYRYQLKDSLRQLYLFKARHPDFNLMLITQQIKSQRVRFDPDDVLVI